MTSDNRFFTSANDICSAVNMAISIATCQMTFRGVCDIRF
jgi:hypothetical protein